MAYDSPLVLIDHLEAHVLGRCCSFRFPKRKPCTCWPRPLAPALLVEENPRAEGPTEMSVNAMRPMKHDDPLGTPVSVVMDDQTIVRTKTRSETWTVGGAHQVVLLEGRTGGYLVKRCSVIEPGDLGTSRMEVKK